MSGRLERDRPIAIAPGFRLQWEEAPSTRAFMGGDCTV